MSFSPMVNSTHLKWRGPRPDLEWRWFVCPACLWVGCVWLSSITNNETREEAWAKTLLACPREQTQEVLLYIREGMYARREKRLGYTCGERPCLWLDELSPGIAATLETLYRIKGPNAIIEALSQMDPVVLGLDDPGGKPHQFYFSDHRPNSVKDEDRDLPSKLIGKRYGVKRE